MSYTLYNLGFKINELQNELENFITATYNSTNYEFRAMNNPTNAIVFENVVYPLYKNKITYNLGKSLGFKLDKNMFVLMYIENK